MISESLRQSVVPITEELPLHVPRKLNKIVKPVNLRPENCFKLGGCIVCVLLYERLALQRLHLFVLKGCVLSVATHWTAKGQCK